MDLLGLFRAKAAPNPSPITRTKGKPGHPTKEQMKAKREKVIGELQTEIREAELQQRLQAIKSGRGPVMLSAEIIRAVHDYDEAEGWARIPKRDLVRLERAEQDAEKAKDRIADLKREVDRLKDGRDGRLSSIRELGSIPAVEALLLGVGNGLGGRIGADPNMMAGLAGLIEQAKSLAPRPPADSPDEAPLSLPQPSLDESAPAAPRGQAAQIIGALNQAATLPLVDRARWFLSLPSTKIRELLQALCEVPDGELRGWLTKVATMPPPYHEIASWTLGQSDEWLRDTRLELRRQLGISPVAEDGAA